MKRLVKESLQPIFESPIGDLLKGKKPQDVIRDIKRRLDMSSMDVIAQTDEYEIYQVYKGKQLSEILKNFGYRPDEEVFYNFYLILDYGVASFNQVMGVKVSPDNSIYAFNAKGDKVEMSYLESRFPDL